MKHQTGQSALEYVVIVALLSLALTVGPDSPLDQLFKGVAHRYAGFSRALSLP